MVAPSAGVRLPAAASHDLLQRAHAYAIAVPLAVISHRTAAVLWGIPLPERVQLDDVIDLTLPKTARACRRRGAQGHSAALSSTESVRGRLLAATSPERTWFDLTQYLSVDELIIAGDHLVRRRQPLSTVSKLTEQVRRKRGHRGVRSAREALAMIRPRTDSPKETELRLQLIRAGLPEPSVNVAIQDENDEWVQDPDMSYQEVKIALQYDGGHHITELQRRSDIARDDRATELGWLVLKYTQLDLTPLPAGTETTAVRKTRRALAARGWSPEGAA